MRARIDRSDGPPEPPARWGLTVAVSIGLHVAGFVSAIALPRLMPGGTQGPPVYVVDLVSPPVPGTTGPPPPSSPPTAATKKKEITRPPRPEPVVKLPEHGATKPEPKATPAETKKPEARPTPTPTGKASDKSTTGAEQGAEGGKAAAAAREGAAAVGGATGGTGTGQADMVSYYFSSVDRRIESAWQKPIYPPNETTRRIFSTTIRITVTSSGRVTDLQMTTSSGYEAMDRSVLRAVEDAQPFPPFPERLGTAPQTVQFVISLTPN